MTLADAERELDLAGQLNPGKWIAHSRNVALRLGVNEFTVRKWRACLEFQHDFEAKHGVSVYGLLGLGSPHHE